MALLNLTRFMDLLTNRPRGDEGITSEIVSEVLQEVRNGDPIPENGVVVLDAPPEYRERIYSISEAVSNRYGYNTQVLQIFDDHIVWCDYSGKDPIYYQQDYTWDAEGDPLLGNRIEVRPLQGFAPVDGTSSSQGATDAGTGLENGDESELISEEEALADPILADLLVSLADKPVSDKKWSGGSASYANPADYCKACLIDESTDGAKTATACKLPVYEPNGALNRNAVHAAAAALSGARGGVNASADAKRSAARKLVALYRKLGEDAPANLKRVAGIKVAAEDTAAPIAAPAPSPSTENTGGVMAGSTPTGEALNDMTVTDASVAVRAANAIDAIVPPALPAVSLADGDQETYTVAALRLADEARKIPEWQQVHRLGQWAVPHAGSGQKIKLTQEMGDTMIRNFRLGAVRRGVPLDEIHLTDSGGQAMGWMVDLRWGKEGEGLADDEPSGTGNILYGRFRYNSYGLAKLGDEQYRYISPQYHLDYQDKETANKYGPALTAVAATNNPFLRLRSFQGEPAPGPVTLSDVRLEDLPEVLVDGLRGTPGPAEAALNEAVDDSPAAVETPAVEHEQTTAAPVVHNEEPEMTEEMTQQLADLANNNQRLSEQLALAQNVIAAIKLDNHHTKVDRFIDTLVTKGVPPALTEKGKVILYNCDPDYEATLTLSEGEGQVNLFGAIQSLLSDLPVLDLTTHVTTPTEEQRPADTDRPTTLDDQVASKIGRGLLERVGVHAGMSADQMAGGDDD